MRRKITPLALALAILGMAKIWAGVNTWTSIGPDGGSARSLAIDPQNTDY